MNSAVVKTNGIDLHVIDEGDGQAVVLCHGFPKTSRSWRHQTAALANAGYRAIVPDMRVMADLPPQTTRKPTRSPSSPPISSDC